MKLIALLVALGLERLATQLFHLRELRWLDGVFDACLSVAARLRSVSGWLSVSVIVILLVVPVFLARAAIGDAWYGLPYLALSVVVLFFSLGPQDIGEEVDVWCDAVEAGESERAEQLAKALLEHDPRVNHRLDEAIFVQANNRIYAVVFWFIVLGPVGAWAVRVADLLRRRAVFKSQRDEPPPAEDGTEAAFDAPGSTDFVHALLAWLPARLAALSYLLVGSFDSGRDAWSAPTSGATSPGLGATNEALLARVGKAAQGFSARPDEDELAQRVRKARGATRLVFRALIVWAVAVAGLTLFGPAV